MYVYCIYIIFNEGLLYWVLRTIRMSIRIWTGICEKGTKRVREGVRVGVATPRKTVPRSNTGKQQL